MKLLSGLTIATLFAVLPMGVSAQESDSILTDDYVVSQNIVEAEIVRVSPRNRTLTVKGANRGDTRQFTIPENARVTVNGREARLRDVRRGDKIALSIVRREQRVVVDRIQVPDAPTTLEQRRANPIVAQESTPSVLPKTASNQPLFLVFGLLALFAAAGLRFSRS